MKKIILLGLIFGFGNCAIAADEPGLKNEAEAGVVISTGNASSSTYNLQDQTKYKFESPQILSFEARYLQTIANNIESARYWLAGLRFEQVLSDHFNTYLGQNMESNVFAGFNQRYNTDIGGKYIIVKSEDLSWFGEAGYRYALTNQTPSGTQVGVNLIRLFTELNKIWDKSVSTKFWVEGTPNITNSNGYRIVGEGSLSVGLSSVFSVKMAYLLKYDNAPPPGIARNTDTFFTTSLVAKF
jgi:putative salt-induced outer membrane protein